MRMFWLAAVASPCSPGCSFLFCKQCSTHIMFVQDLRKCGTCSQIGVHLCKPMQTVASDSVYGSTIYTSKLV